MLGTRSFRAALALPQIDGRIDVCGLHSLERNFTLHGKRLVCLTTVAAVACMATGVASASAATITGAGSTLVQPLEALWAAGYASSGTGNTVSYSGVGSGTGITDITNSLVDFGASDAPLSTTQQAACPQCVQMPWALSATAVGFHLTGITS